MPTIRSSGAQISRPVHVKFTSQGVYITNMQETADAITKRMMAIVEAIPNVAAESMREALQPIFDLSQKYVPVDTGDLKRSGFLEVLRGHYAGGPRVVIGYGRGGHPWYAAYVHEATWIQHAKGKYAKFLERAVNERIHIFKAILLQSVQAKLKVGSAGRVR